jgi:hypothetical protein
MRTTNKIKDADIIDAFRRIVAANAEILAPCRPNEAGTSASVVARDLWFRPNRRTFRRVNEVLMNAKGVKHSPDGYWFWVR